VTYATQDTITTNPPKSVKAVWNFVMIAQKMNAILALGDFT